MLEKIISPDNMNLAYKKVIQNKGTYGIDGMTAEQFLPFLERHGGHITASVLNGTYTPQPVRSVSIPKGNGGFRDLGIPTFTDRLIQRAVVQILMPLYETEFAETSYGFRPERSIEDAVIKCQHYFTGGFLWCVDMDLEKFFDTVCREKLMQILAHDINDDRVVRLISSFINSGTVKNGQPFRTSAGIPQGGPLSPLLANIMLNELDQELMQRGEKFVRYADDMLIFCRNKASAYQALKHITPYIEEGLFLNVNRDKTIIAHADTLKFLGYGFFMTPEGCGIRVHEDSVMKLKSRIKAMARHIDTPEGMRRIEEYITSWICHYRLADFERFIADNSYWLESSLQEAFIKIWLSQQDKITLH